MLLETIAPDQPDWYKQIFSQYKLQAFLLIENNPIFFNMATESYRLEYINKPIYDKTLPVPLPSSEPILQNDGDTFTIVIYCAITHLRLGEITFYKNEHGGSIRITELSSMRGVFLSLRLPGTIGTAIGSLLITSLTILLKNLNMLPHTLELNSLEPAEQFYKSIGMIQHGKKFFSANIRNIPQ